ncbi:galactose oxidase [Cristinia sonorae]|uniref:Galactose oxidase n=1 Tax=Cristinia sonorae TaxID=1940300 RepID=A0A8K0UWQ7_9AGAR|nr:galactose oxidase [Cristinia sonorae]
MVAVVHKAVATCTEILNHRSAEAQPSGGCFSMGPLLPLLTVLAVVPQISLASHHPLAYSHRQHARAVTLPAGWTARGCVTDNPGGRTLGDDSFTDTVGMTVESCVTFCNNKNFIFAGLEFSQECYCGNSLLNNAANATSTDCNDACKGDATELCGGASRLNLYWSGRQPPPPPTTVPSVGLWESLGCFNDTAAARTLSVPAAVNGNFSVETCTDACFNLGYPIAGMEFADECYCDTDFRNGGSPATLADCNMPCKNNGTEFCGGPNRLNVYNFTGTLPHGPVAPPPPGGGGGGGTPVFPATNLPPPWKYAACFVDNAHGRIFQTELNDNPNVTVESCIASCSAQNQTLAGLEFSVQCFCGTTLVNGAVLGAEADCNMGCGGNTTEACGGPNRLSVYTALPNGTVPSLPVPVAKTTGLPTGWSYSSCIKEGPNGGRVLPNQIDFQIIPEKNTTIDGCLTRCREYGYPAAGLEFGSQCYCGDFADVATNSGGVAPEADCSIPCSGDLIHLCGGPQRLQYYKFSGTIDVWHQPANIGRYEFLIGGLVVPLVATVGINGKVNFLEKLGTGFPNSTGAYELDLSLVHDFDKAWRALHVHSDVFCSGSLILPDKSARQLNVGGWSLESTFGVRLYAPDGKAGVNGTNDWEENFNELHLQRGRWYPSALVMANGSVMVVGGEQGSNGFQEPTIEILPTPAGGPTWLFMDWLNRTDPNNLYPFLHVLPSGNIFVGYYNEARILNPKTFDTITVLPNMPGSVIKDDGGRTYPMEGTAVLLPQHAPYTDPLGILICGGSDFGQALDNCITTQPEVPNPTWTIERMPSKRVMPCMAALPDGTFLIVNGAEQGVAGFGLADFPNLSALLYDPSQPVHQRISILNNTIVARLYHSEATLLPDGRVLISGSDPQTNFPNGTVKFPEEFRVEVYIPPYLNQGFTQPSYTITQTDWAYGGSYAITVTLHQGTTANMRVSLVAATSSTHGNVMGGRTIFPAFSCTGNTCHITAPPNANVSPPGWHQLFILDGPTPSHSQFVRIGGDPGKLGNWPAFADFTLPGV